MWCGSNNAGCPSLSFTLNRYPLIHIKLIILMFVQLTRNVLHDHHTFSHIPHRTETKKKRCVNLNKEKFLEFFVFSIIREHLKSKRQHIITHTQVLKISMNFESSKQIFSNWLLIYKLQLLMCTPPLHETNKLFWINHSNMIQFVEINAIHTFFFTRFVSKVNILWSTDKANIQLAWMTHTILISNDWRKDFSCRFV